MVPIYLAKLGMVKAQFKNNLVALKAFSKPILSVFMLG